MAFVGITLVAVGIGTVPVVLLAERLSASLVGGPLGSSIGPVGEGALVPLMTGSTDTLVALFGILRSIALVCAGLVTGIGLYLLAVVAVRGADRR